LRQLLEAVSCWSTTRSPAWFGSTCPVNVTGCPVTALDVLALRLTRVATRSNTVRLWIW
jgi:hypothetical protein